MKINKRKIFSFIIFSIIFILFFNYIYNKGKNRGCMYKRNSELENIKKTEDVI